MCPGVRLGIELPANGFNIRLYVSQIRLDMKKSLDAIGLRNRGHNSMVMVLFQH